MVSGASNFRLTPGSQPAQARRADNRYLSGRLASGTRVPLPASSSSTSVARGGMSASRVGYAVHAAAAPHSTMAEFGRFDESARYGAAGGPSGAGGPGGPDGPGGPGGAGKTESLGAYIGKGILGVIGTILKVIGYVGSAVLALLHKLTIVFVAIPAAAVSTVVGGIIGTFLPVKGGAKAVALALGSMSFGLIYFSSMVAFGTPAVVTGGLERVGSELRRVAGWTTDVESLASRQFIDGHHNLMAALGGLFSEPSPDS